MPFWGLERIRRGLILRSSEEIGTRNTCTGPMLSYKQVIMTPFKLIQKSLDGLNAYVKS